jgi:serine/threonine-protein kinase
MAANEETEGGSETVTLDDRADAAIPARFPVEGWNRYRFVSFIGRGGMGAVYKAEDPQLSRYVALKFLVKAEAGRARRFIEEARAQARVEHEHVCKVYEVGNAKGVPYIAMQFIDGLTLGKAGEQMSVEDKVHVLRKVADAVHAAHQTGLIHRDLKRSNVMVERGGGRWQPFVLDFGLARDVETVAALGGEVAGTPAYMAPEQARGERADRRTDVWGLGATMYALLAGRPPNQSATGEQLSSVSGDVPSIRTVVPQLPGELAAIVMKCLQPTPERRYQSAAEVSADLRRYLAGEPIAARPRSLWYRANKRLQRSWGVALALAIAGAALVAVAVMWKTSAAQRREADERVAIAQHFGQEVARLETFMHQAYAAPLHDTRRERKQALERVAAIEKEAHALGDVATGPAEYAIGRVQLSLHDPAAARVHLQRALDAGHDTREVRYALGLALAGLYREAKSDADRMRDSGAREARRATLRATLRDPALGYLRAGDPESSTYAEGLIALYEGDFATALAKAQAAAQVSPSMYEAHQLAGDALIARAGESSEHGGYADAAADLERAGKEYDAALAAAPSDARLLDAECKRRGSQTALASDQRRLEHDQVDKAVEPCERARQADPDDAAAMVREAFILADGADYLADRRGERPDAVMARALPLVESALAIDPKSARAYHARSVLFAAQAHAQADRREDCEDATDKAITALRQVIELDSGYADAYADIAYLLQERAEREREKGHDPRAILDEAVQIAERGIAMAPQAHALQGDLGTVWNARADYEAEHGLDPQVSLGKAIAAFEASLAQNPKNGASLNNMGLAIQTRAFYRLGHGDSEGEADLDRAKQSYERVLALGGVDSKTLNNLGYLDVDRSAYLARSGRDPRPAVAEGLDYEQRALAANPAERFAYFNIAGMKLTEAEYLLDHGEDPSPALAAAQKAIDADLARAKDPDPDVLAYACNAQVLAARWAMKHKASPEPAFGVAERMLARAEQLDASTGYVVDARYGLELWRTEWLVASHRDAAASLARAKAAAKKYSDFEHDGPPAHLVAGELAVLEARSTTGARRSEAAERAKQELDKAVAGNRFYERRAKELLEELPK